MSLPTIELGIEWLRDHHDGSRAVPSRLHKHDTEGELGAPPFSAPFMAYLMSRPTDTIEVREAVPCDHYSVKGTSLHDETWPSCTQTREFYRAPMWRAMNLLSKRQAIRPHQPTPYELVSTLLLCGYDWRVAVFRLRLSYDVGEALMLMALRSLEGLYCAGPVPRRSWTSLSESQQNAEGAVA